MPERIFNRSNERYLDEETGHRIATITIELYGKIREVMLAYIIEGDYAKLLTVHPLKEGQKEKRVRSGRWRKI